MKKISNTILTIFLIALLLLSQASIGKKSDFDGEMQNIIDNFSSNIRQDSIQKVINQASKGDTIVIPSGTYHERLTINKSVTIIGEEKTVFDGSYENSIMRIEADHVRIKTIHFRNSGALNTDSGIKIFGNNITIQQCVFYQSKQGIHLQETQQVTIQSCLFYKLGRAIAIHNSNHTSIINCSGSHCAIGFFSNNSTAVLINHSRLDTNGISIYLKGSDNVCINHSSVKDNSDNHGGIFIEDSSNIKISLSSIHHNGIGINIEDTNEVSLRDLHITNNTHFGILLRDNAKEITITRCTIKHNLRYGIYSYMDTSSYLTKNVIVNNILYGLYSDRPVQHLKQNWWGSSSGPSFLKNPSKDRLSINNYITHFSKWSKIPYNYQINTIEHQPFYKNLLTDYPNLTHYIQGIDSDDDGCPDWWEEKWGYERNSYQSHRTIDGDGDGLTNLEECYTDQWGSSPFRKDIFLEVDWIESDCYFCTNEPSALLLSRVIKMFEQQEISLHIDAGEMGAGGSISNQYTRDFSSMVDIYWKNFLNNDMLNPRKGIFRYAIIGDYCADVSYPFIGWDQFDSIAISADEAKLLSPQYPRQMIIVGGILHQLGSTLGLLVETHPGNDNLQTGKIGSMDWFTYRSYKSSMNYLYKYRVLSYSDGTRGKGDFNDWDSLNFSFFKETSFSS